MLDNINGVYYSNLLDVKPMLRGLIAGMLCVYASQGIALSAYDLIDEGDAVVVDIINIAKWSMLHDADIPTGCRWSLFHDAVVCP